MRKLEVLQVSQLFSKHKLCSWVHRVDAETRKPCDCGKCECPCDWHILCCEPVCWGAKAGGAAGQAQTLGRGLHP